MKTLSCSQEIQDRRRTKDNHKSSPCHYLTGELKKGNNSYKNLDIFMHSCLLMEVMMVKKCCKFQSNILLSWKKVNWYKKLNQKSMSKRSIILTKTLTKLCTLVCWCKLWWWIRKNEFGKHQIINEDFIMFTRNCGQTTDKGRSQKLTLSQCDRWAKKRIGTKTLTKVWRWCQDE